MTARRATGLELLDTVDNVARHEAQRLLLAATGWTTDQLFVGRRPSPEATSRFAAMLERRVGGEPLQYIEGTCDFGPLTLRCDPRALIPRPETEQLWEHAVRRFTEAPRVVVDVGTGTGCLALACKLAWPDALVYGTEASNAALSLAVENVALTGLDVTLLVGDLFDPLPEGLRGEVDLIISNPPYLAAAELEQLPAEVRHHEPEQALVSGASGLEVLQRIAEGAGEWLKPGGTIICEISEFRGAATEALFAAYGAEVLPDLTDRPRFVVGQWAAGDAG